MPHAFLAALQLADSFFPSGMYAQSHGLEAFIAAGATGAAQIEPLLHSYLLHVAAPADALAARWAARAAHSGDIELVAAVDARLEATKLSTEARVASRRCGGRMLLLGAEIWGGALLPAYAKRAREAGAPGHQSVALALIAAASGVDEDEAALVELYTFAASLVGAAVRLAALDHAAAQRLLLRVQPAMAQAALEGRDAHWRDIGGFAPQVDVAQFRHRFADVHMFVS